MADGDGNCVGHRPRDGYAGETTSAWGEYRPNSTNYSSHDFTQRDRRDGRPGQRPQRDLDPKERVSKSLSRLLRHKNDGFQVRADGFALFEDAVRALRSYSSDEVVDVVEWSVDRQGNRRFEMALNVAGPSSTGPPTVWIRATRGHSNNAEANSLPNGVTQAQRSEFNQQAMAEGRKLKLTGRTPGARRRDHRDQRDNREHHNNQERMDNEELEPRRAERELKPSERQASPVPGADAPAIPEVVRPTVEAQAPERRGKPPPTEAMKQAAAGSTLQKCSQEDQPPMPTPPPPPGPPRSQLAARSVSFPEETHPTMSWPPTDSKGVGRAKREFDGTQWSRDNPGNDFYISFAKDEEIAVLPNASAGDGWQFGIGRTGGQPGWFPDNFIVLGA
eukprot:TRINITY_DN63112_c0_g1_i1.p1 TRINITY_DN63112_c0_g1~~TRINITY_DN63112_c0_g1_i1.p1  ORF type:complete len:390 (-),score=55.50 TRINITY_DN63112_c0_g1_i1:332-1501(-)